MKRLLIFLFIISFNGFPQVTLTPNESFFSPKGTLKLYGEFIVNDEYNDDCVNCNTDGGIIPNFIPTDANWNAEGHREWLSLFSFNRLESPYQDGHYIYIVMPGSGSGGGDSDYLNFSPEDGTLKPPILVVADLENPSQFHREFIP